MVLTLLLFGPGPGLLDKIIDAAEGSASAPVHAAVQLDDRLFVEAVWPQVRLMFVTALPAGVQRVPLTLTDQQAAAVSDYLCRRVGQERYSIAQLGIDAVGAVTHRWLPAPTQSCDCSGLIAQALASVGIVPFAPRDTADVTPADLAAWCAAGQPATAPTVAR